MSAGYVCDRCGAAIFANENRTLLVSLQKADVETPIVSTVGALDLCVKCAESVEDIIRNRIITSKTAPDSWLR